MTHSIINFCKLITFLKKKFHLKKLSASILFNLKTTNNEAFRIGFRFIFSNKYIVYAINRLGYTQLWIMSIVLIRYIPVVCKAGRGAWSVTAFHGHLQSCNECRRPRRNAFGNLITYALFSIFHKQISHPRQISISTLQELPHTMWTQRTSHYM